MRTIIFGIVGTLFGLSLIVVVVILLIHRQERAQLLAAEQFVFRASRRGEPDKLIKDKLLQAKWNKHVVDKALYHSHLAGASEYAKTRLAEGATPKQVEQELVKNGWRGRDAHRAVRQAQHPKKAEKQPQQTKQPPKKRQQSQQQRPQPIKSLKKP